MIRTSLFLAFLLPLRAAHAEPPTPREFARQSLAQAREAEVEEPEGEALSPEEIAKVKEYLRKNLEVVLAETLKKRGLEGRVHAAVLDQGVVLFQVTNPFAQGLSERLTDFRIYPLRLSKEQLDDLRAKGVRRNDFLKVKGTFASIPPHIEVDSVEVTERTQGRDAPQNHELRQALALHGKTDFVLEAQVHASLRDGAQAAVDYQGHILPVTLENEDDAKGAAALAALWRFDIARIPVKEVRAWPAYPPHLVLDSSKAIRMVESIRDFLNFDENRADPELTLEGTLVRIPPSSGLTTRESWGLLVKSEKSDISRQFLLWNFSDFELQEKIEAKLKGWWDSTEGAQVGRNRLVHPGLTVRAKGKLPMFSGREQARNQGNHFFHVYDVEDIELVPPPAAAEPRVEPPAPMAQPPCRPTHQRRCRPFRRWRARR